MILADEDVEGVTCEPEGGEMRIWMSLGKDSHIQDPVFNLPAQFYREVTFNIQPEFWKLDALNHCLMRERSSRFTGFT